MKFKVTYYDYDTDSVATKNCVQFEHDTTEKTFTFIPLDDPIRVYKTVIIDHPIVNIFQHQGDINISVKGYQSMKSGGYWKTETVIKNVKDSLHE